MIFTFQCFRMNHSPRSKNDNRNLTGKSRILQTVRKEEKICELNCNQLSNLMMDLEIHQTNNKGKGIKSSWLNCLCIQISLFKGISSPDIELC